MDTTPAVPPPAGAHPQEDSMILDEGWNHQSPEPITDDFDAPPDALGFINSVVEEVQQATA